MTVLIGKHMGIKKFLFMIKNFWGLLAPLFFSLAGAEKGAPFSCPLRGFAPLNPVLCWLFS